jgi:hypothetical protein
VLSKSYPRLKLKLLSTMEQLENQGDDTILQQCEMSFRNFKKLPRKIRFLVWETALSTPQVVMVEMSSYTGEGIKFKEGVRPISSHSPLLRVNKESRGIATSVLERYLCPNYGLTRIFANLQIDIIWCVNFAVNDWMLFLKHSDLAMTKATKNSLGWSGLRRLGTPYVIWHRLFETYTVEANGTLMHIMKNLWGLGVRELFMVVLEDLEEKDLPHADVKLAQLSQTDIEGLYNGYTNPHFKRHLRSAEGIGRSMRQFVKEIQKEALDEISSKRKYHIVRLVSSELTLISDIGEEELQSPANIRLADSIGWTAPDFRILVAKSAKSRERNRIGTRAFLED